MWKQSLDSENTSLGETKNCYETDIIDIFIYEINQLGVFDYHRIHNAFCKRNFLRLKKLFQELYNDAFEGFLGDVKYLFKHKIPLRRISKGSISTDVPTEQNAFDIACESLCVRDFTTLNQVFRIVSFQRLFKLIRTCYVYRQNHLSHTWSQKLEHPNTMTFPEIKISLCDIFKSKTIFKEAFEALNVHKYERFIEIATQSFSRK